MQRLLLEQQLCKGPNLPACLVLLGRRAGRKSHLFVPEHPPCPPPPTLLR